MASLIEEVDPDVVLLDLMLPGTDGIEVMQDILAVRDTRVIFLSAYSRKLGDSATSPKYIATIAHFGYRMGKPPHATGFRERVTAVPRAVGQRTVRMAAQLQIEPGDRSVGVGLPLPY